MRKCSGFEKPDRRSPIRLKNPPFIRKKQAAKIENMKAPALLTAVFALLSLSLTAQEGPPRGTADLISADDARIAAMIAADRAALEASFSDDLRYAHSSGTVDSKASFIEAMATGATKYLAYDHLERNFTFPAPGIALMTGRARFQVESARGKLDAMLSYLAVWREEKGRWRFLAWQSCRLTPAEPKP